MGDTECGLDRLQYYGCDTRFRIRALKHARTAQIDILVFCNFMIAFHEFRQSLIDAGLNRVAHQLCDALEPCVDIRTAPVPDDVIPVGTSKFGGQPDTSPDFVWPLWNNTPLSFLGQINLAAVAKYPCTAVLPTCGLLSFFYDPEQSTWGFDPRNRGSWQVLFTATNELERTPFPNGLPQYGQYTPCQLEFTDSITPASSRSKIVQKLGLSEDELDIYSALIDRGDSTHHHLLGCPQEVQGEMQLECQLVSNGIYCGGIEGYKDQRVPSLKPGATDWRLLLQLDSDDNTECMWGDLGRLYFWITNDSLQSRQFAATWMILQCG